MKKLTGFIVLWITTFSILWVLDENELFSYRTIEIFFGEKLTLPSEYSTKKINLADLGKRSKIIKSDDYVLPALIKKKPIIEKKIVENLDKTKKIPNKNIPSIEKKRESIPSHIISIYKRGDFYACLYNIKKEKETSSTSSELDALEKKCKNLMLLAEGISRKKRFSGKISILKMKNGKEYIGRIIANDMNHIDFESAWGTIQIPKNRILSEKEFDNEVYRKKLSQKFKTNIRILSPKKHTAIMKLFKECYQNNMDYIIPLAFRVLESKNIHIVADLVEYKASKIYQSYLWCQAMTQDYRAKIFRNKILDSYPFSEAAKQIKQETVKKIAQKIAKNKPEKKISFPKAKGSASQIVKKANNYYAVAYKYLKKSFPGQPNADNELAKAKENFQKACKYYQEALSLQPNNKKLETQLQQSMEFYHHCIKQTRLK